MTVYTIGFTKKSARAFFDRLATANVRRVIDVRLHNTSQLAGFAKRDDLEYFLRVIGDIEYVVEPLLAPSAELFRRTKSRLPDWSRFGREFRILLERRHVHTRVRGVVTDHSCLLCSEDRAESCHRSLVVDYLASHWKAVNVVHL